MREEDRAARRAPSDSAAIPAAAMRETFDDPPPQTFSGLVSVTANATSDCPPRWSMSVSTLAAAKRRAAPAPSGDRDAKLAGGGSPAELGRSAELARPAAAVPAPARGERAPPRTPTIASVSSGVAPFIPEPAPAHLRAAGGYWRAELKRGTPHWLLSLLVHMLLMVVFGSLVARPAAQHCVAALGTISASFSNLIDADSQVTMVQLEIPGLETQITPKEPTRLDDELDRFAEVSAIEPPPPAGAADRPTPSDVLLAKAISAVEADRKLLASDRVGASAVGPAKAVVPATVPPASQPSAELPRESFDEVVDQFIKFDIGRLHGAAGVEAKRAFDALGTEAIPALVRGLNKAAHIRASCPVMVISSKLQSALAMNHDRSLLEYAVENLGRDVPASAPYAAQVRAIQAHWEAVASGRVPSNGGSRLGRRIAQGSSRDRIAAARSVAGQAAELNDGDRKEVGWALATQLKSRDAKLRDAAHGALVALADGEDFGPEKKARPGDVQKAVCEWCRRFDAERFDREAHGLFAAGERLDERDQSAGAMHFYRRVVTEYVGSAAADEAAKRLDAFKSKKRTKSS